MKLQRWWILWMVAIATARGGNLVYEDFDALTSGSITNVSGWTRSVWVTEGNSLAGEVSGGRLTLPWAFALGRTNSSAMYTNFSFAYRGTNNPVIRLAGTVYRGNRSQELSLEIRHGTGGTTGRSINVWSDPSSGLLNVGGINLGIQSITGRYVDLVLYYNMSNGLVAFDYNGSNVLPWTLYGGTVVTQCNQVGFARTREGAGSDGVTRLDNLSVEAFAPGTWAWWRFDRPVQGGSTAWAAERLGHVKATPAPLDNPVAGASDPVWDGLGDTHNEGAQGYYYEIESSVQQATPRVTNWTVEAVFRQPKPVPAEALLAWGYGSIGAVTGSAIDVGFVSGSTGLYYNLRDHEQGSTVMVHGVVHSQGGTDDRWHHVALVKTGATLLVHLDYQLLASNTLGAAADGSYFFGTTSLVRVGYDYAGSTATLTSEVDELRFSTRALDVTEFLQPGQPLVVDVPNQPPSWPWQVIVKTVVGKTYRLLVAESLAPTASWSEVDSYTPSAGTRFWIADVPAQTGNAVVVRVLRDP